MGTSLGTNAGRLAFDGFRNPLSSAVLPEQLLLRQRRLIMCPADGLTISK